MALNYTEKDFTTAKSSLQLLFINEQCFKSSQNQHIKSVTQNFRDLKNEPIFIIQEPTKLTFFKCIPLEF